MTDFSSDRIIRLRKFAIKKRRLGLLSIAIGTDEFSPGSFRKNFESKTGPAREDYVYQYVTKGLVPKPKLVPITVQDPKNPSISMTYEVMPDYFSIEGMPVQITPITAEKIGSYFGLNMPTKEMTKHVYDKAKNKISGKPGVNRLGADSSKLTQYNDEILKARKENKAFDPNAITVGEYKELELKHAGDNLHASGMLDSAGNVIQDFKGSTAHDPNYVDYSHAARFAGNFSIKDERGNPVTVTFDELISNPKYKQYAQLITGGKSYSGYKPKQDQKSQQLAQNKPVPTATQDNEQLLSSIEKELKI